MKVERLESRYALAADGDFGSAFSPNIKGGDGNYSIAVDASENTYVGGNFAGTIDVDPGPGVVNLTSAGEADGFVAMYSSSGTLVWARRFGGATLDELHAIAVDSVGNIYATGEFTGTAAFNPTQTTTLTSSGGRDVFVTKLSTAGELLWAQRIGGSLADYGNDIAVDEAGNVYTAGSFQDSVDFDPGTGVYTLVATNTGNSADGFVSKLDPSGNFVYAADFVIGPNYKIAVGSGNAYVVNHAGVYTKLDSDGNVLYVTKFTPNPGAGYHPTVISVDSTGGVFTAGTFRGTIDFDPGPNARILTSNSSHDDLFVSRFDTHGNYVYAQQLTGTSDKVVNGLGVDASGNLYINGGFQQTLDVDPGPGTQNLASSNGPHFVCKLDASGQYVYAKQWSNGGSDIAVTPDGNVYTTGGVYGTVDFDPGPGTYNLTSSTQTRLYVCKLVGGLTYVENSPPIYIAVAATLAGSTNYADGQLKVQTTAGGSVNDVTGIANQGTGTGQIGVSGNNVQYQGATIGTFSGGTNYSPLVVNFNSSSATTPAVQALIRAITFSNTSDAPYTALRNVKFTLSDGHGSTIYPAEKPITVVSVNDLPTLTAPSYEKTPINQPYTFPANAFSITDLDAGTFNGQLTLTAVHGTLTLASTAGITFTYGNNGDAGFTIKGQLPAINNAIKSLKFTPANNFYGLGGVSLVYNDFGSGSTSGGNLSASGNVNISIFDPSELVVFTYDPEFSKAGNWSASGLTGYNGTPTLYGHGTATWAPTISQAGNYKVEFWRVNPIGYRANLQVVSNGQTYNQQLGTGSDGWVDVGTHAFSAQGDEYFKISINTSDVLRASAVRFTRIN